MHPGCRHRPSCGVGGHAPVRPGLRFPYGTSPREKHSRFRYGRPQQGNNRHFWKHCPENKTDSKGKWSVTLPPMPPCATGQTLAAVQNGDSAKLEDVLVGEVWLASGQSNMLFRLNQTTTAKEDIAASGDDQLRLLNNVPQAHTNNAPTPRKTLTPSPRTTSIKGNGLPALPPPQGQ